METNPYAPPSFLDNLGETYSERNSSIPPDVARIIGETSKWIRLSAILFRIWIVILCGTSLAWLATSVSFTSAIDPINMLMIVVVIILGVVFHYAARLLFKSSAKLKLSSKNQVQSDLLRGLEFHHTYWVLWLIYEEINLLIELGTLFF